MSSDTTTLVQTKGVHSKYIRRQKPETRYDVRAVGRKKTKTFLIFYTQYNNIIRIGILYCYILCMDLFVGISIYNIIYDADPNDGYCYCYY